MNLVDAINVLDETDFAKLDVDPEVAQAIATLLIASKVRARTFQAETVNAVVETTVD